MSRLRIGIVDTGVNPWHSHVRGAVAGCRIYVAPDGSLREDDDFSDPAGHGTAVAGVIREAFPEAEIYAVRVFDTVDVTYPSVVARGILRAAAEGCAFVNLSLAIPPGPGSDVVAAACSAAIEAGCVIVASSLAATPDWLPACLPGVYAAHVEDALAPGEVRALGPRVLAAPGRPRALAIKTHEDNFAGASFACARVLVHLARRHFAKV
jgi:hypothetical protein